MTTATMPAPETVHVDVCGPGMPCLRGACRWPAELWIQREGDVRMHYCLPDAGRRIRIHWEQGRRLVITPAAKALLDEAGAV